MIKQHKLIRMWFTRKIFSFVWRKGYTKLVIARTELDEEDVIEVTKEAVEYTHLAYRAPGSPCLLSDQQIRSTKGDQLSSNDKDMHDDAMSDKQKQGAISMSLCHCNDFELQALTKIRLRFRRRAMGEFELKKDLKGLYDISLQNNLREINLL